MRIRLREIEKKTLLRTLFSCLFHEPSKARIWLKSRTLAQKPVNCTMSEKERRDMKNMIHISQDTLTTRAAAKLHAQRK